MNRRFALTIVGLTSLASACGGGGGSVSKAEDTAPPEQIETPETVISTPAQVPFFPNTTASAGPSGTFDLGGAAIRTATNTGAMDLSVLSGLFVTDTGGVTVTDTEFSLSDPDGFNTLGRLQDDGTVLTHVVTQGQYDYVILYQGQTQTAASQMDVLGVLGVVTPQPQVPWTDKASFEGEAGATAVTANGGYALNDGMALVTADFKLGTVNVTLSGFSATDMLTQTPTEAPIDTILGTNLLITQSGFSGNTIVFKKNGFDTNITGPATTSTMSGAFFGTTPTGRPDEAAGVVVSQGEAGMVSGWFITD